MTNMIWFRMENISLLFSLHLRTLEELKKIYKRNFRKKRKETSSKLKKKSLKKTSKMFDKSQHISLLSQHTQNFYTSQIYYFEGVLYNRVWFSSLSSMLQSPSLEITIKGLKVLSYLCLN